MTQSKICSSCKNSLSLESFSLKKKSVDGLQDKCKSCAKRNNAKYYQENLEVRRAKLKSRKREIQEITRELVYNKLKEGCVDCSEKDLVVLDFDHVSGAKRHSISYMVSCGFYPDAIKEEISKCVVRCANCHRRKTAKDFDWRRLRI